MLILFVYIHHSLFWDYIFLYLGADISDHRMLLLTGNVDMIINLEIRDPESVLRLKRTDHIHYKSAELITIKVCLRSHKHVKANLNFNKYHD